MELQFFLLSTCPLLKLLDLLCQHTMISKSNSLVTNPTSPSNIISNPQHCHHIHNIVIIYCAHHIQSITFHNIPRGYKKNCPRLCQTYSGGPVPHIMYTLRGLPPWRRHSKTHVSKTMSGESSPRASKL